jgi:hypothetical protein
MDKGKGQMYFTSHIKGVGNEKIGTVVSTIQEDGQIMVGYSICCNRDIFTKKTGRALAMNNMKPLAMSLSENAQILNFRDRHKVTEVYKRLLVVTEISKHVNRIKRYYKEKVTF